MAYVMSVAVLADKGRSLTARRAGRDAEGWFRVCQDRNWSPRRLE
jgi:hypothetical protein